MSSPDRNVQIREERRDSSIHRSMNGTDYRLGSEDYISTDPRGATDEKAINAAMEKFVRLTGIDPRLSRINK